MLNSFKVCSKCTYTQEWKMCIWYTAWLNNQSINVVLMRTKIINLRSLLAQPQPGPYDGKDNKIISKKVNKKCYCQSLKLSLTSLLLSQRHSVCLLTIESLNSEMNLALTPRQLDLTKRLRIN